MVIYIGCMRQQLQNIVICIIKSSTTSHPSQVSNGNVSLESSVQIGACCMQNIIDTNNGLREALHLGLPADKVVDSWDFLQVNCAMYINSDVPGLSQANQPNTKPLR